MQELVFFLFIHKCLFHFVFPDFSGQAMSLLHVCWHQRPSVTENALKYRHLPLVSIFISLSCPKKKQKCLAPDIFYWVTKFGRNSLNQQLKKRDSSILQNFRNDILSKCPLGEGDGAERHLLPPMRSQNHLSFRQSATTRNPFFKKLRLSLINSQTLIHFIFPKKYLHRFGG